MSKAIEQATSTDDMKDYLDEDALREAQIDRRLKTLKNNQTH